ncbi:MAG: hypothetical protein AAGA95_17855 [Pseudomonadota bacterium]
MATAVDGIAVAVSEHSVDISDDVLVQSGAKLLADVWVMPPTVFSNHVSSIGGDDSFILFLRKPLSVRSLQEPHDAGTLIESNEPVAFAINVDGVYWGIFACAAQYLDPLTSIVGEQREISFNEFRGRFQPYG